MTTVRTFTSQDLITLLTAVTDQKVMTDIITNTLSETQQEAVLTKVNICWLLENGFSYLKISEQLNVSSATVAKVATDPDTVRLSQVLTRLAQVVS